MTDGGVGGFPDGGTRRLCVWDVKRGDQVAGKD